MPVTEITLLQLPAGSDISNETLRSKLKHAKIVTEKYANQKFYMLQQIEDPSCLYIIGEWDSIDQHINHFLPSEENQALLESFQDELSVPWLLYLDVSHVDLPLPKTEAQRTKALQGEPIWIIARYFIKEGEKDRFIETFDANQHLLQNFVTEGTVGGGWRVGAEREKLEKISLCPWKAVEQHREFVATEECKKYLEFKEHIERAEIKHARLLEI